MYARLPGQLQSGGDRRGRKVGWARCGAEWSEPEHRWLDLRQGQAHSELLHGADRITTPLRRAGPKGCPGEFAEITWDEAPDEFAARSASCERARVVVGGAVPLQLFCRQLGPPDCRRWCSTSVRPEPTSPSAPRWSARRGIAHTARWRPPIRPTRVQRSDRGLGRTPTSRILTCRR
jgi:hypothetical protein